VYSCHSLQALFETITFPPLPVCHSLTFHLPIRVCCFCSTCHVRCMLDFCWPWGSCVEQASYWHCFEPGRHAGETGLMGGCTPLHGPRTESSGITTWIQGSRSIRAELPPVWSLLRSLHRAAGVRERRDAGPHCEREEDTCRLLLVSNATGKGEY